MNSHLTNAAADRRNFGRKEIMIKNYWRMSDFTLFSVQYAYVDHSSYLADQLFVQNKVTLRFKGEMVREDSPYCIIFCKVQKKDVERFERGACRDEQLLCAGGLLDG
jgi:hypothetical protein